MARKRVRDEYPKQPSQPWLARGYSFLDWSLACHLAAPRAIKEPEGKWEQLSKPMQEWLQMKRTRNEREQAEKAMKTAAGKERSRRAFFKMKGWLYDRP